MNKYKIIIAVQACLVILVLAISFIVAGSPLDAQKEAYDINRLEAFSQLSNEIDTYYSTNKSLPEKLEHLNASNKPHLDPETKQPYEFIAVNQTTYQLCATFNTTISRANPKFSYQLPRSTESINPGRNCLEYTVNKWARDEAQTSQATPTPTITTNSTTTTNTTTPVELKEITGTLVGFIPHQEPGVSSQLLSIEHLEDGKLVTKNFRFPVSGVKSITGETLAYYQIQIGDTMLVKYTLPADGIHQAVIAQDLSR